MTSKQQHMPSLLAQVTQDLNAIFPLSATCNQILPM